MEPSTTSAGSLTDTFGEVIDMLSQKETLLLKKINVNKGILDLTAFNEMFCDARELADEIDIPANFELSQPRHTVRRRNVNFDYEARDDPIEDPTLKNKAEFIFSHLNPALI
ncbi:uncharacterized protein TNCV_236601 [Trichonephila clavipes]|nr:uncharacterized protein TNCV_236601 [Trichonephila clavipes]